MSTAIDQTQLQFVRLNTGHQHALEEFFARIAADESGVHFHPHPFTDEAAVQVCCHSGKDLYFGMLQADVLVGYGMLRGWNEGFRVPSLGIYVAPRMRGTGAARFLMEHMHESAKRAGARKIRLKVHIENVAARRLYLSIGYRFDGPAQADGQMVGFFDLSSD